LDFLWIENGKKDFKMIFGICIVAVKTWGLNLTKCVGFGFNGASTMVGKNIGVVARLKKMNSFLILTHCVTYKTNLAILEASK